MIFAYVVFWPINFSAFVAFCFATFVTVLSLRFLFAATAITAIRVGACLSLLYSSLAIFVVILKLQHQPWYSLEVLVHTLRPVLVSFALACPVILYSSLVGVILSAPVVGIHSLVTTTPISIVQRKLEVKSKYQSGYQFSVRTILGVTLHLALVVALTQWMIANVIESNAPFQNVTFESMISAR